MVVDPMDDAQAPYNGSKSLVTGRKGFSPFFKSVARDELETHCTDPILLTRALSLNESYEAACICRLVTVHASGRPGTLADMVWMPQSLRSQALDYLNLRLDFLLGKARLTPNADRWKNWSGEFKMVYVSKNQKKKQQAGQELALVSLADFEVIVDGARVPAGVSQLSSSAGKGAGLLS